MQYFGRGCVAVGGMERTAFPPDEKIFLPPHDRHKDTSRCYFKGKGFGGEEGSRKESSTPNQGSKPRITEGKKKVQSLR